MLTVVHIIKEEKAVLTVTDVKITFMKDLGELSEKKLNQINDEIKVFYPSFGKFPFGFLYANNDTRQQLIIAPGQLTVDAQANINFDSIKTIVNKVFDILLLDSPTISVIVCTGLISHGESAFSKSLSFLEENLKGKVETLGMINGIGLRFFTNKEGEKGEFKIEPFVRDPSYFYVERIIQNDMMPLSEALESCNRTYMGFKEEYATFATSIIE